jgi:uncharacterized protein YggE
MLTTSFVSAQEAGNYLFGNSNSSNYYPTYTPQSASRVYLSDSAFLIQANVMMNVIADSYVATFGVSEISTSLPDANAKIDARIEKFVDALSKLGVQEKNIYIDMTTQTLLADYKINGNYAEQYISGYEQKKNVIVRFNKIDDLDKMVLAASDQGIYDLAKVDYIVTDINTIYTQLFQSALDVINSKKALYIQATGLNPEPVSEIYAESFLCYYPSQLYKSYTVNVSTLFYDYNSNQKRKDLPRNTTYYYDKLNYSGFDKVINPVVTEPAVEYVMTLQIKYNVDKSKK